MTEQEAQAEMAKPIMIALPCLKFPHTITPCGTLKNLTTGKIRKFQTHPKDQYPYLVLKMEDGSFRKFRLHRLLAEYFIPNPDSLPCVNHKDGDKLNNSLENLEWISYSGNIKHAYDTGLKIPVISKNRKLKNEDVLSIRSKHSQGISISELGRIFKVSRQSISELVHNRRYKEVV